MLCQVFLAVIALTKLQVFEVIFYTNININIKYVNNIYSIKISTDKCHINRVF